MYGSRFAMTSYRCRSGVDASFREREEPPQFGSGGSSQLPVAQKSMSPMPPPGGMAGAGFFSGF